MKRITLIGAKDSGEKNDVKAIAKAIKAEAKESVETHIIYWEDLRFDISRNDVKVIDSASGFDLAESDQTIAVNWYRSGSQAIYRDVAYALALYLSHHQKTFWNSEMIHQRSTTKLSAMVELALHGLDVPHSVFSLNPAAIGGLPFNHPVIVKDVAASRGRNNHLAQDDAAVAALLNSTKSGFNSYIVQECIPNDHDLRIVCLGGEPHLVIKRSRTDDSTHLNNTSLGAAAELVDMSALPKNLLANCREICHIMGRELAGIDVLMPEGENGRYVFLEVNAIPQLTSGSFVDEKLQAIARALAA